MMPVIVAHRGGAGLRPENTLAACAHALTIGAEGLEIDVRLSRDGDVVVFHDAAPDPRHVRGEGGGRLRRAPRPVRELSFRELRTYDVGWPRAPAGGVPAVPGQRIPALREVMALLDACTPAALLMIELKTDFHTQAPLDPAALTDAALAVAGAQAVRLLSFDWRCLVHAMKSVPAGRCCFLTPPREGVSAPADAPWFAGHAPERHGGSAVAAIRALGGRHWGPHHSDVTARSLAGAREAGLQVAAWTVNEAADIERMLAFGVDYLITDYPDRALRAREAAKRARR